MKILNEDIIYKISDIEKFKNATSIYLSEDLDFNIDLSKFLNLKQLRLQCKKYNNIATLSKLEYLNISSLKKKNVTKISQLFNLRRLDITRGDFEDLKFIELLEKLEHLELNYLNKLKDISSLSKLKENLVKIEFDSCKKIENFSSITGMKSLIQLSLINIDIKDIEFVTSLPNLKRLLVLNSNIFSGDISPARNLEFVGIDNRNHYNYKYDNVSKKILKKKNNIKSPLKNTYVQLKYFGNINITALEKEYSSSMFDENYTINLDLNFEKKKINRSSLKIVEHVLKNTPFGLNTEFREILKTIMSNESLVLYHKFICDEFPTLSKSLGNFIASLDIIRIGFYPESKKEAVVFDMKPRGIELDHALTFKMNNETYISEVGIES